MAAGLAGGPQDDESDEGGQREGHEQYREEHPDPSAGRCRRPPWPCPWPWPCPGSRGELAPRIAAPARRSADDACGRRARPGRRRQWVRSGARSGARRRPACCPSPPPPGPSDGPDRGPNRDGSPGPSCLRDPDGPAAPTGPAGLASCSNMCSNSRHAMERPASPGRRRRRRAGPSGAAWPSAHRTRAGVRRSDVPRGRGEVRAEPRPGRLAGALPLDGQPLPGLRPRLRLLPRRGDARAPARRPHPPDRRPAARRHRDGHRGGRRGSPPVRAHGGPRALVDGASPRTGSPSGTAPRSSPAATTASSPREGGGTWRRGGAGPGAGDGCAAATSCSARVCCPLRRVHTASYRQGYLHGLVRADTAGRLQVHEGRIDNAFPSERLELEALGRAHHLLSVEAAERAQDRTVAAHRARRRRGGWPGHIVRAPRGVVAAEPEVAPALLPSHAVGQRPPDPDDDWCAGFLGALADAVGHHHGRGPAAGHPGRGARGLGGGCAAPPGVRLRPRNSRPRYVGRRAWPRARSSATCGSTAAARELLRFLAVADPAVGRLRGLARHGRDRKRTSRARGRRRLTRGRRRADVRHHHRHRRLRRRGRRQPQLLRPQHPHLPRPRRRRRLRPPDRGQGERRAGARARTAGAALAARTRGDGHQHRPLPAGGRPLPAHAGHRRRAGPLRHAVLRAHQGHGAGPRPAPAAGRGGRRAGRARGVDRADGP